MLLPFHYFGIADESVEYSAIPWRSGRFDPSSLENALMLEKRVDEIIRHAREKGFDGSKRRAVGFCAGIRHARFMQHEFGKRGLAAESVITPAAVCLTHGVSLHRGRPDAGNSF